MGNVLFSMFQVEVKLALNKTLLLETGSDNAIFFNIIKSDFGFFVLLFFYTFVPLPYFRKP
ncbi:MAG: hypothetical protein DI538_03080 [Azospira oryzae]|nr:MAG: hypothetical protein DI538_03080 [Azospira oryzae]